VWRRLAEFLFALAVFVLLLHHTWEIDFMNRISVVEALRALASISVALFHFCNGLHSTGAHLVTRYGWLGVDVFFVISGFVIPLSLYGRGYGLRDFPSFLFRRLVRLEPAYLVSIAVVLVLWYASSVAPGFAGQAPNYSFAQLASHVFYIIPLTSYQWLNPVYWSLAYEFVFYVTVGLTFSYLIERSVAATVVLAFGALGLSFAIYNVVDVRIVEFLVGALLMRLAVSDAKDIQTKAWLLASLVLVLFIGGIATGIAVSFGALSILFLRSVEFGRLAIFLGSISYSLYLIHAPIGGRVINLARRFGEGPLYELVIVALALSASVMVAMLLHRFVEAPAMMASRKIGRRAIPTT
jgi:peptidoglycan/LPS O-acetylase OafA/YrhL